MTWIFGSFLVTPHVLTSCHVVINKQAMVVVGVSRFNRCVTGRRPRDNYAVRFRLGTENRESSLRHAAYQRRFGPLWRYGLQEGASVGTPWPQEEDMGQEVVPFLYMSLHLSLKLTTICGPLSRIKWEIYFYKEVFRSFIIFDYVPRCS